MTAALAVPPPIPQTPPTDRRYTIVLDPGHGGIDPGATGPQGIVEKDITLTLAMELKRQLEKIERYRVVLTRERDVSMALAERVQVARNNSADLFISLHADSNHDARVRGATFYTLSGTASDAAAAEYAAKENRADIIAGVDLRNESEEVTTILIDLAQRETMSDSVRFARAALKSFTGRVSLAPKSHRFAGFKVLKAPDVPSVLIEFAYLTNKQDETMLTSPISRARLIEVLAQAIDRFCTEPRQRRVSGG
jgi:N-acetylmuramoyl-L-alanine amidase